MSPAPERVLSLASGVVPELAPENAVQAAGEAGYAAAGLWFDPRHWSDTRVRAVRAALEAGAMTALDIEAGWLNPGEPDSAQDAIVAAAGQLGAQHVLVVSSEPDLATTKRRFAHLCRRAEDAETRIVLEFLGFTEVKSLAQALEVVRDVAHPAGGVLVDALHLARTGSEPSALAGVDPHWIPYVQLCDATQTSPPADGLLREALDDRLCPGEGELPLGELLATLPADAPLSLEIRSRDLRERLPDGTARAREVLEKTRRWLAAQPG